MRDVVKTEIEKPQSSKRARRRRRNSAGYYFVVLVLVLVIGTVLSMTLLFNVNEVQVAGLDKQSAGIPNYTAEELVEAAEIENGDNMVRMSTDKIRSRMLSKLICIDDIKIKKRFPDTLYIEAIPSVPRVNIRSSSGYILVSEGWRILEIKEEANKELLMVEGYEMGNPVLASHLESEDPQKTKILENICGAIDKNDITGMTSINMEDKYNIIINYDNRIDIKVGNSSDMDYKLRYAYQILKDEISSNKTGYLIFIENNQYSFVTKESMQEYNARVSENLSTESTTQNSVSEGSENN